MQDDIEKINVWAGKSKLEQTIAAGVHGAPELKADEKTMFLGEFKERVLKALTKEQVREAAIYTEAIAALQDQRAVKLVISGDIDERFIGKYLEIARKHGKPYTIRHDSNKQTDVGLVVAGADCVAVDHVMADDRTQTLTALGLPPAIVAAAGGKLCKQCYELVAQIASAELINYRQLGFLDKLTGEHCPAH